MKILFVCTGNTCRSPMAEVLMADLLSNAGIIGVELASAGIAARNGQRAAAHAVTIMGERGLDLSEHRSQMITPQLLSYDLILTMTEYQRDHLLNHDSSLRNRVYALKEYACPTITEKNIVDPFGGSLVEYRQTAAELHYYLKQAINQLQSH